MKQMGPERQIRGIKCFPECLERLPGKVSEDDAAALSAKDISEGVDMDPAGIQEGILTRLLLDLLEWEVGCQRPDGLGGSACKPAAVLLEHFLKLCLIFGV